MEPEVWLDAEQGNDNIHYAVPNDYLVCSGISQLDPMDEWPSQCGTGPDDSTHGVNWRHYTYIAPEYGTNANHTGFIWTIDTTDPAKPFLVSKWKLPGTSIKDGEEHPHHYIPGGIHLQPAQRRYCSQWDGLLDPLPRRDMGNGPRENMG